MTITVNTLAPAVGVKTINKALLPVVSVVKQRVLVIAPYDETKTVTENVPLQYFSPEDAGAKTGFGYALHRLVKAAFENGANEVWASAQPITTATESSGTLTITGTSTGAGSVDMYIGGDRIQAPFALGATPTEIAEAVVTAVTATPALPVSAANVAGVVTFTAKSGMAYWGDSITLAVAVKPGDFDLASVGVTGVIVAMASGAGTVTITDALTPLGTGDASNEKFFTEVVTAYEPASANLEDLSVYNGVGQDYSGNYADTVGRPFIAVWGSVAAGTSGLTAIKAVGDARKTDRTNVIVCRPADLKHPAEIAAGTAGIIARIADVSPATHYLGKSILGTWFNGSYASGDADYDWASNHNNRDSAAQSGLSPTVYKASLATLQNVFTLFHPDDLNLNANAFRYASTVIKLQNILYNLRQTFESEDWQGVFIVEDATKINSEADKLKVRDLASVKDEVFGLIDLFVGKGWLYESTYAKANTVVSLRESGNGFDVSIPAFMSRDGLVVNVTTFIDANIAGL